MTIFACVNTKGGVGKTTTAVHLAVLLSKDSRTLLIDGDPQASAASWAAWRREKPEYQVSPTTTCLAGKAILHEGKPLAEGYAHTVVDAGGRDSAGLRSALLLAQRAIIPIGASQLDAAAMTDVMGTLKATDFKSPPCVTESAGFCTEHSAKARSVGFEEERSPTLRAGVVEQDFLWGLSGIL